MTAVGDILKSTDPDSPDLQVLGATEEGAWIVQEADEFGTPRSIEPEEIVAYGVDSAPERRSELEGWRKIGEGTRRRPVLPARPLTPEQALAQGQATTVEGDGEPKLWAPVIFTDSAPWLRRAGGGDGTD